MLFDTYYLGVLLVVLPLALIYRRAGLGLYWLVLLAVPDIGVPLCIIPLGLKKWPAMRNM